MKTCSKCGVTKPLAEFATDKAKKDGHRGYCLECRREYARAYRDANEESVREGQREWRERNRERLREKHAQLYRENPDYFKQKARAWAEANPERTRELSARNNAKRRDLVNSLKTPCQLCGESFLGAIDFHHIDPARKRFAVTTGKHTKHPEEVIAEAAKCICICSNCHRKYHGGHEPTVMALHEILGGELLVGERRY